MNPESFDYTAYLATKKAIDDASLNPDVWQTFTHWLAQSQRPGRDTLTLLEAGAGTGTMILRLLENGLSGDITYTAIEMEPDFRQAAAETLRAWCAANGYHWEKLSPSCWHLHHGDTRVAIQWHTADLLAIQDVVPAASCDLLLAHAVVDLLPVPRYLPVLLDRLVPGGGFLFSINYAGETVFTPPHELDEAVMTAYHGDMDKRFAIAGWRPSHTGNLLGPWLEDAGHALLAQGPSDWRLPSPDCPPAMAGPFVANILDTVESALPALPGINAWLADRRRQLADESLRFRAANRDFFGLKGQ